MGTRSKLFALVACTAFAGQIPRLGKWAPHIAGTVIVACTVAVLVLQRRRASRPGDDTSQWVGPLGISWLIVSFLPVHKFDHQGYNEVPSITSEIVIHIAAFAIVALISLVVLRTFEHNAERLRPPLLLAHLPLLTILSCLWSFTPQYAFVRGCQLLTVAALAWATIALGRASPKAVKAVLDMYLRWFVRVAVGLIGLGLALGPLYVWTAENNKDRFTWMGAHPLAAGLILSSALVVVLATPIEVLKVPQVVRFAMAAAFVAALVPNQTRQAWLGLGVVLVLALGLAGRLRVMVRWLGAPLLGAGVGIIFMLRGPEIYEYILRDGDASDLTSGNGRLQLWGIGFDALDTAFNWFFGLGFGITRFVFAGEVEWARSAHNSFLATLVSLGLVGLVIFVVVIVVVVRDLIVGRLWTTGSGFSLTLLFAMMLFNAIASDNMATPNIGFAVLYLVAVVAMVNRMPVDATAPADATLTERARYSS